MAIAVLVAMFAACSPSPPTSPDPPAETSGTPAGDASSEAAGGNATDESTGTDDADAASGANSAGGKKHKFTNRLSRETSPYLKLHGHNPVDWYPWGEEALAKAKKEGKLIFLSVGYSSCHWCHVMERETFENEEIAAFLNSNFVCIKVDREERPDVDHLYMTALHVFNQMAGRGSGGGWPLSMFLTSEAKPFYGATYIPPFDGDRGVQKGFYSLVQVLLDFFRTKPDQLHRDAEMLTQATRQQVAGARASSLADVDKNTMADARRTFARQFDDQYGGFGYSAANPQSPKFPEPSNLLFLLDYALRNNDQRAREMVMKTLEKMAQGGIYDHLGGGFHRYSVDRFWHIPHFEKMLYDNGQLASTYAAAYEQQPRDDFRRVIEGVCDFVLTDMRLNEGGFYSAIDADPNDEEGAFYRWKKKDIQDALSAEEFELFASVYGLERAPNFEGMYYVPQLAAPLADIAADKGISATELEKQLSPVREKLLAVRNKRERPLIDTKILTSWNGLMIAGLADAGRVLNRKDYVQAAQKAASFVLKNLRMKDGRLVRTFSEGHGKLNAYLTDYTFLVDGLIALHRATGDKQWLETAEQLTDLQVKLFHDKTSHGFFFTTGDHESMFARAKRQTDNVEPAGNSVAAHNLLRLGELLDRDDFRKHGQQTIKSTAFLLYRAPTAAPRMLLAAAPLVEAKAGNAKPTAGAGDEPPEPE